MLSVHAIEIPEQVDMGAQAMLYLGPILIQHDLRSLITINRKKTSVYHTVHCFTH